MKKLLPFFLGALVANSALAQSADEAPCYDDISRDVWMGPQTITPRGNGPESPLWSEDFALGFPAGWGLHNPTLINPWRWSTNGSKGYFNGNQATAPTNPIASPTAANGFLINDPDSANHVAYGQPSGTTYQYLESFVYTKKIDLGSVYSDLVLEFYQSFRFNNNPLLEVRVSNDSINWTTYDVKGSIANNTASANPTQVSIPISPAVGSTRFVYIAWGWSARVYFWMIDDIQIKQAPANALQLVTYQGAPPTDILYRPNNATVNGNAKYGNLPIRQTREINFDANVYNWGSLPQTNVRLEVTVYDASGAIANTVVSPTRAILNPLDTMSFDSLTTAIWQPAALGNFTAVYRVLSDSINMTNNPTLVPTDSLPINITDTLMTVDFGTINNVIGTNSNFGEDACSFMPRYDLTANALVEGVWVHLSNQTQPGGSMQLLIHDTTGLNLTSGFVANPLATASHTVTAADITNGFVFFPLATQTGDPIPLQPGSYYVEVVLFSNALANPIFIGNDQSVNQPGWSTLFYSTRPGQTPRYFTGFTGSRQYSSPLIRLVVNKSGINLEQLISNFPVRLFPNPAKDQLQIELGSNQTQDITVRFINANGQLVQENQFNNFVGKASLDIAAMAKGLYFVSITNEKGATSTFKLMVQ